MTMQHPLPLPFNYVVSAKFGFYPKGGIHSGVDYAAAAGTAIFPIWSGKVIFASTTVQHSDFGYFVVVRHDAVSGLPGPLLSLYAHMAAPPLVRNDSAVTAGITQLGAVGNTGRSDDNHLHLSILAGYTENEIAAIPQTGTLLYLESQRAIATGTMNHDFIQGDRPSSLDGAPVARADMIIGMIGNDTINGGAGNDSIDGSDGNDWLNGESGTDALFGGLGNDIYCVQSGDVVTERANEGIDLVWVEDVSHFAIPVNVENAFLANGSALLVSGNALGNLVSGNSNANHLRGYGGNDRIAGNGGEDTITGGVGRDTMHGGSGADEFHFYSARDSLVVAPDLVVDFTFTAIERDRINLAVIDANTSLVGDQGFTFIGANAFSGAAGELRAIPTAGLGYAISGDTNGDRVADIVINVVSSNTPTVGWFIL